MPRKLHLVVGPNRPGVCGRLGVHGRTIFEFEAAPSSERCRRCDSLLPLWQHLKKKLVTTAEAHLAVLDGLVRMNLGYLRERPATPSLFKSGVSYADEPGNDVFQTIAEVLKTGQGDAEDLVCWRAAELRLQGIKAEVSLCALPMGGLTPLVVTDGGVETIEDIGRRLRRE